MAAKTTISISEARKKIFEIAKKVQAPNLFYTLTENGTPKAVILSAEEFESWLETLEVAHEFPDLHKDLKDFEADVKNKKVNRYHSLADVIKKLD